MEQKHHISRKVEWLLKQPGMSVPALLKATNSEAKSTVSEWKRTGRIAKAKLLMLANFTGIPAEWWLDESAAVPPPANLMPKPVSATRGKLLAAIELLTPKQEAEVLAFIETLLQPARRQKATV